MITHYVCIAPEVINHAIDMSLLFLFLVVVVIAVTFVIEER